MIRSRSSSIPLCVPPLIPSYLSSLKGLNYLILRRDHRHLLPLTMRALSASREGFKGLLDSLTNEAKGGRSSSDTAKVRDAMRLILMNLADAIFTRRWIVIHGFKASYSKGSYYDKLFLGFNRVQDCLRVLEENELVDKRKGYIDDEGNKIPNKYFPTPKLQVQIWEAYFALEQEIKPPYVINKHDKENSDPNEVKDMAIINDFMKGHTWASKGPIRIIYTRAPMEAGRLITPFQNLPSKKIKVRINTLINGNPMVEVDYKANHINKDGNSLKRK